MRIAPMRLACNADEACAVPRAEFSQQLSSSTRLTSARWNFGGRRALCESSVRKARPPPPREASFDLARGELMVRVLPSERLLPTAETSSPLPESGSELPPVIRRAELVAFALVALLVICIVAVLWAA